MADAQKKCYLFVGNPGTGKSTILNGIIGEPKFLSQTSKTGYGVTYQLDKVEIPGKGVYMDTPGMSCEKLRKEAGAAITTALKQDGYYKIFFVVTVESGKVRPDDKTTIRLVLDASPEIINYGIIVNKVTSKWAKEILQEDTLMPWVTTLMSGLPKVTDSIHFMHRQDFLEDEDNVKFNAPEDVIAFVDQFQGMTIRSESVKDVQTSEFDELKEENAKHLQELQDSKEQMEQQTARVHEEIQKLKASAAQQAASLQAQLKDAKREKKRDFWGAIGHGISKVIGM